MLMTKEEREQFLETCNLLGVTPFDALGYKEEDLFQIHFNYLTKPIGAVKFINVNALEPTLAWFKSENGSNFLAYFYEVTPYDPS